MMDTTRLVVASLVVCTVIHAQLAAQGLSGSLSGSVKDEHGGVLAGATVSLASPALIGGDQRTTTDDRGRWRFPVLAPGMYVLVVEMATGFAAYREEGITIGAGAAIERLVVLKLASVAQSVTVTAGSSVESRSSGLETRFGPDYLATIPTRRFGMFDAIRSAPGMSPTSPSSGTVNTVSSFGSGVNENAFLIDGTDFTCPCSGVSRAEPSVDVIQEVHVQSIGASVEFGNIQGAVINVVTKQGGARFQSQSAYYAQSSGLTAQPIVLPVTNGTQPSSGYERVRYRDFSTGLGGPVLRDRLWFYGAYQYLRDYDSQPGADPAFPRKYEQDKVFGKLTWRLTPSLQMMQSFHEEFWENPDPPTLATPFEATLRRHASVPSSTFANVTYAPSGQSVWDLRVGRYVLDQLDDPSTGDRTMPNRRDRITGFSEAQPAGAERRAHADIALARDRAAQNQVRDVRARDEQNESDGAEQDEQRTPDLARQLLGERDRPDRNLKRVAEPGRIVVANPLRQRRDVGRSLCGRRAVAEPPDHAVSVHLPACLFFGRREDEGHPDVGRSGVRRGAAARKLEPRRHHAHHRDRPAVDGDRGSDRRASGEVAPPETVADDRDVRLGLVLFGEERATLGRFKSVTGGAGERDALACVMKGDAEVCAMLDLNWEGWVRDGTIDANEWQIIGQTDRFDHCVFTVRQDLVPSAEKTWLDALFAMRYDDPAHREMMDLEGLKAWLPGRTTGFGPLTAAVESERFFTPASS